jgi:hypothetical protein
MTTEQEVIESLARVKHRLFMALNDLKPVEETSFLMQLYGNEISSEAKDECVWDSRLRKWQGGLRTTAINTRSSDFCCKQFRDFPLLITDFDVQSCAKWKMR